jgi:hypothetical protein
VIRVDQLDDLVAPIALYSDPLLEVVQLQQSVKGIEPFDPDLTLGPLIEAKRAKHLQEEKRR